jgi:hypothetical protein
MWKAVGLTLKEYWRILVLGVAWLGLLISLLAWGLVDRANAKTDILGCPGQQPVAGIPSQAPKQPAQLKPRSEPRSAIAFYQDRIIARRRIEYDITDPAHNLRDKTPLEVSVAPFVNASNGRELRPTDINATAKTSHSRVILDVCFNRTDPKFGSPGSYNGVITIIDPRVTATDVTFAVTMAYPWWQLVLSVLVAMLLPAILYVWFLRGSFTSQPSPDTPAGPAAPDTPAGPAGPGAPAGPAGPGAPAGPAGPAGPGAPAGPAPHSGVKLFEQWIFSRVALMSYGAGVAAAVGIFSATYARTENWGSDYTAATALFGAAFSAFIAAATGVTAAGADKESHKVANRNES